METALTLNAVCEEAQDYLPQKLFDGKSLVRAARHATQHSKAEEASFGVQTSTRR